MFAFTIDVRRFASSFTLRAAKFIAAPHLPRTAWMSTFLGFFGGHRKCPFGLNLLVTQTDLKNNCRVLAAAG